MLGRNIKKYRLLSGLSMREMANKLGVSHQTIKKYEDETMIPNSERLIEIAKLLNVSISDLVYTYNLPNLKFKNFRKNSSLNKKKEEGLKMLIGDEISKYLEIMNFADNDYKLDNKKWKFEVETYSQLEKIASDVRKLLGESDDYALDNLTDRLENNNFLILEIDYDENFDGFSEFVDGMAFIVLSSKGYERNRFTLAHELGHLILDFKEKIDGKEIEHYCHQFASCLLMPEKAIKNELAVGKKRILNNVSLNDVLMLASQFQVSLNAVIMRLYSLGIIDDNKKKAFFVQLSKLGIKNSQLKFVDEHPTRKNKTIFRLEAEKIISKEEAIKYLGVTTDEYIRANFNY